ncbi:MAG: universal stress protein [Gammaproteobacteria bacterium]|jgi:nucleotide-binding universal stress UspA family protein|nr:universal stress protein [Gammaproteobacteria bacterium]
MSVPSHILVATDFSQNAAPALERAAALARAFGARLTLTHALRTDELSVWRGLLGSGDATLVTGLRHEAEERLAALAAMLGADLAVDAQVLDGQPATAIPELAASCGVDLLVLGQHGAGAAPAMLLGSTASRLLRRSRHPVLLVRRPAGADYAAPLVAVDFSPASEASLRLARTLVPRARLTLAHAPEFPYEGKLHFAGIETAVIERFRNETLDRARGALHRLAAANGLEPAGYDADLLSGEPSRAILARATALGCDLIVIGKHGRHVVEELLLGSVTRHVIAEAAADVLVVVDARRPPPGASPSAP